MISPTPSRPLAVVCLSGGMDSAVTAAMARETHDLALLHANYGQRTESRELLSFEALADRFGVAADRRLVVDFTSLRQIGAAASPTGPSRFVMGSPKRAWCQARTCPSGTRIFWPPPRVGPK